MERKFRKIYYANYINNLSSHNLHYVKLDSLYALGRVRKPPGIPGDLLWSAAQTPPRGLGPRGTPVVRPPIRVTPPRPVIVVPPCKRGGPGITPC